MALYRTPSADHKRWYPVHRQIGLVLALGLAIAAFTVPLPESRPDVLAEGIGEAIEIEEVVDPTRHVEPPPPPPPAPPPPQEVPDDVVLEEQVIEALELDLGASVPVPLAPPPLSRRVAPPPPPGAPPPPPPPPEEPVASDEVFEVVEVQPELIGGLARLQARLVYPEMARLASIEGQVLVQCVVDERGAVTEPVVLRSPHAVLSEEALRAVAASEFTPGQQRGRPVRVRYVIPVRFELRDAR